MNKTRMLSKLMLTVLSMSTLSLFSFSGWADEYSPTANCTADASWFEGKFNPKIAADNFDDSTICDFHQFSWRSFIWLTEQADEGKLRFETFYSDTGIYPDSQPGNHLLGGVNQAGSNGILIDQHGRALYTSMMINDIYRDFVIKHKLYTQSGMQQADNKLNFPNGAMSLKAAWKIVQPGEDTSGLYTTKAPIQLLTVDNGQVVIPENAQQEMTQVALVGFHIAVYVNKHPEAIWATFEFKDNAPTFAKGQSPNKIVSDKDYLFYKANTLAKDCNTNNAGMNAILKLDTKTQTMAAVTQTCLQYAQGTVDNLPNPKKAKENVQAIISLNDNVHQLMPKDSIWRNYLEIGAVWFSKEDHLTPDWSPNMDPDAETNLLIGSTRLSNSTIETFTQNQRSANECFSCHNTTAVTDTPEKTAPLAGKNINTSHILLKNYLNGHSVKRN